MNGFVKAISGGRYGSPIAAMAAPWMAVLVEELVQLFPADGQVNNQGPLASVGRCFLPAGSPAGKHSILLTKTGVPSTLLSDSQRFSPMLS